jgi:hypothetical protein
MPFNTLNLPRRAQAPEIPEWELAEISGGINYEDQEYKLADDQSPYAKNVWYNNRILSKRWGFKNTNTTPLEAILAAYPRLFLGYFIIAAGTKLYKYDPAVGTASQLITGLTAQKGFFFQYGNVLYYINGAQYVQWDGAGCAAVTPYIPTVVINRPPTGGGTVNEDYNRVGAGFKNSFNGTAGSVAFTLTDINLDATEVTAIVNGVVKVENTHFTVNRNTGIVTFDTATGAGTNNVIITAYKTDTTQINTILTCTQAAAFGGQNDSRMFLGGNGTPIYYWSEVDDPSYFPLTQYNIAGGNYDEVTAFGAQYDVLAIFKKQKIGGVTYQYDIANAQDYFNYYGINSQIGCDAPGTMQLIGNRLTWLNTQHGVCTMLSTAIKEQNDVQVISRNINGNGARSGLLQEANLEDAIAISFDNKYWLCVNEKIYLWDFGVRPYIWDGNPEKDAARLGWWIFDNIDAQAWMEDGENLYFGDSDGFIKQFENTYSDAGVAIDAYWKLAIRDFGLPEWLKTIRDIWYTVKTETDMEITVTFYSDEHQAGITDSMTNTSIGFSYDDFYYDNFYYGSINFPKTYHKRLNMKKIVYFSMMFSNDTLGMDLNISDIRLQFSPEKMVR